MSKKLIAIILLIILIGVFIIFYKYSGTQEATDTKTTTPSISPDQLKAIQEELTKNYDSEAYAILATKMEFEDDGRIKVWLNTDFLNQYNDNAQKDFIHGLGNTNQQICKRNGHDCYTQFYSPENETIAEYNTAGETNLIK